MTKDNKFRFFLVNVVYLGSPFKGCLPQILLGPFLNTLTQIAVSYWETADKILDMSGQKHHLPDIFSG